MTRRFFTKEFVMFSIYDVSRVIVYVAGAIAVCLVVAAIWGALTRSPTESAPAQSSPAASTAPSDAQLRMVCRDFVLHQLHDPRDAQLDWTDDKPGATSFQRDDGLWVARFRGRARNQYGALHLGTFECVMSYTPPDTFRAVSVRVY
jgi:hypothetical protein